MRALSSLAGHDIIFHSAREVMTRSNPYWINAFMKAPLFPWSHIIPGLQSPQRHDQPLHIPLSRPQTHTQHRLDYGCDEAAYRCPETRFTASCLENLSENARAEMKLGMWSAWHFYSRSFSSAYGSSLKSNLNLHKEPRSQRFSGVFCWASRELTLL